MRLGNAEDVRKQNLALLLSKACKTYISEVLEQHKLYSRYADDFTTCTVIRIVCAHRAKTAIAQTCIS